MYTANSSKLAINRESPVQLKGDNNNALETLYLTITLSAGAAQLALIIAGYSAAFRGRGFNQGGKYRVVANQALSQP